MKHPWRVYPKTITVKGRTKLECLKNVVSKEKIGYECLSQIQRQWAEEYAGDYVDKEMNRKPIYNLSELYVCVMKKVN